ncbi:MAG: ORC-CDC6 family AAA ATPase [Candidatus Helarchaeota archaeon]
MNKKRKETLKSVIENPFEKVTVEQFNDNYSLLAYLFAKPEEAIYSKLIGRENYIIVGGWGSGKTMLLKYLALETQIEAIGTDGVRNSNFIGFYIKPGRGSFKPFLKPGGEFKEGGESLFGHYFNLLILEKIISVILYAKRKNVFNISPENKAALLKRIISKFSYVQKKPKIGFSSSDTERICYLQKLKDDVASYRREIETFLNTRDLEKDLSYKKQFSIFLTDVKTFLDEVINDIKEIITDLSKKRFYILLDECEQFSKGQQKIINTIIKQRLTTMVFKLASRPPDIQTRETIDEGIGLTDREVKRLHLDEMYDPASKSYRDLCYRVAKKRLENYSYPIKDIRKILGKYTVDDEIGKEELSSYLKNKYPSKERVEKKFKEVYKDYKVASAFQILRSKRAEKKYAGFDSFVMLSSGIMLHFLELCRDTFSFSFKEKYLIQNEDGSISFKQIPLSFEIENKAAKSVSEIFYQNIRGRAESLKDSPIDMEFGGKIQYIVSVLGGVFREKLMTFNEPEAARIEIPEGIDSLDNSTDNPIHQIFTTAIAISVFQEGNPYMPKRVGGIRPPTYILNRILAPYCVISPRPRWRTKIQTSVFNKILRVTDNEFKSEVFGRKKKKKMRAEEIKKERPISEIQLTLPLFQISESMPILKYLANKTGKKTFEGKTILIVLHFLKDLIPFVESCKNTGALPSNTIIFYKDYQYPNKDKIKEHLKKNRYEIHPLTEVNTVLKLLESKSVRDVIIIEDGGYLVPKLHRDFKSLATATLGAVEQTTRGIRNDQQIKELLFPVISLPGSKLKDTFEPPHIARAVVNNIQKLLPNKNFSGKKALVIGYGNIGEHIALQLRDTLNMQVSIYDIDNTKLIKAKQSGFDTEENLKDCVKEKFIIVGATGETVIGRSEILAMEHNVYLISASSEQWEFCISELDYLSSEERIIKCDGEKIGTRYKIRNTERYINLIADGYPINFWNVESMPNEVSDLIMSLIFISSVEIATNRSLSREINHNIINELDERGELSKIYLEYHK